MTALDVAYAALALAFFVGVGVIITGWCENRRDAWRDAQNERRIANRYRDTSNTRVYQ